MSNLLCKSCPSVRTSPARQAGLSIVELMIALVIGLVLLLGISTLIVQQNSSRSEMDKSSRQLENGRYAIQLLHDEIQLAGFYGGYSPANGVASAIHNDPCDTTEANLGWNAATPQVPIAIHGYAGNAGDPSPGGCLENYLDNTAVLITRRVSSTVIPPSSATPNTTYLQVSNCSTDAAPFVLGTSNFILQQRGCATTTNPSICTAINPDGSANTWMGLSCLRLYIVRIYYISSCSVCGSDNIPTLKVREMIGGIASTIPLVEGIQNMQFDYGIDGDGDANGTLDDINGDGAVNTMDFDGAPDSFTATPAAATWPHVMAVRVNLLARNNEPTPNHKDSKQYSLGGSGTVGPFNDTYKRHAYSQLVRAINPSGRRE